VASPPDGAPDIAAPAVGRPSEGSKALRGSDFVQSLERGLAVIRAFDGTRPELTLSDVARVAGLTRAAARRFLLTLVDLGYVRTDGRLFALRPRILELGYAYLSSLSLPEVAQPHMEALVARVHESCSVSVLDETDVVYVARVPTRRIMTVAISVGTRFPAFATSMGRVLLAAQPIELLDTYLASSGLQQLTSHTVTDVGKLRAELTRVRAQGYCLVDQELEKGLRSIAAPIRNGDGTVIAAINISLHVSRGTTEAIKRELLPALLETATDIDHDLRRGQSHVGMAR
jgi:IclR family pca regulon transcriptional regulator